MKIIKTLQQVFVDICIECPKCKTYLANGTGDVEATLYNEGFEYLVFLGNLVTGICDDHVSLSGEMTYLIEEVHDLVRMEA